MKSVTWVEVLLAVALAATTVAICEIARKTTAAARAEARPKIAAFESRRLVPQREASLARAREEASRAFTKLVDARLEVLHREAEKAANVEAARAEVIAIGVHTTKADTVVKELARDLAARRGAAGEAFRKAVEAFDCSTQRLAAGRAAVAVGLFLAVAFGVLSVPIVRRRLQIIRRIVFGATVLLTAAILLYQWGGTAEVVVAAGVVVVIAVFFIALSAPVPTEPRQ